MKFIAVYDKDAEEYSKTRIGFLENATNIRITHSINGEYSLDFELPVGDTKWGLIDSERKVGWDGKVFRIKEFSPPNVSAISLMQDACRTHIQYIGDMIGKSAYYIFTKIFETTPYVTVLSENEITALGMEPVTDTIDFFEQSKKTPIGCLSLLQETLDKYRVHSEVYIDNEKIGLVRALGKDRGVRVDPKYNASDIQFTMSTYGLITKLYPYGTDDMPLAGEQQYILSPNYDKFGEYCGFCNFDEIDEPDELLSAAEWQFSEDNIDRIDIPKYSVSGKFISATQQIYTGDTVTIADRANGITSKQRIIRTVTYPNEPEKNTFEAGHPTISVQEAWQTSYAASQYLRIHKNGAADEIKTGTLEFMDKNTEVQLVDVSGAKGTAQKIAKYSTGALFEAGLYGVAIMDGKIQIGTRSSASSDNWNWTAVFDGGKIHVGEVFTGTLYSDLVKIMSDDGTLSIEGNIVQMFDSSGTLRLNAGYNKNLGRYVFELYNSDGARTAYLDDDGNLTIRGIFKTGEDNEARTVIDGNGIQSYDANGQADGLFANSTLLGDEVHNITLCEHGNELFKVFKGTMGVHMSLDDNIFLICNGNTVTFGKTLMYQNYEVANKGDIQNLQQQIDALKNL